VNASRTVGHEPTKQIHTKIQKGKKNTIMMFKHMLSANLQKNNKYIHFDIIVMKAG